MNQIPLNYMLQIVQSYIFRKKGILIEIEIRNDLDLQLLGRAFDYITKDNTAKYSSFIFSE